MTLIIARKTITAVFGHNGFANHWRVSVQCDLFNETSNCSTNWFVPIYWESQTVCGTVAYFNLSTGNIQWHSYRVTCALRQEIFFRLLSTKTTEFEVKNSCKSADKVKQNIYCSYFVLFCFRVISYNAISVRNDLDKTVIVGGSNNAGGSPQSPEANGGSVVEPLTLWRILQFFPKNTYF